MRSSPNELSAGFILFTREESSGIHRFLVLRAYKNWDFPKGRVEPGEDAFSAARRETAEETDLRDFIFPLGKAFRDTAPYGQGKVARFFLAEVREPRVTLLPSPELGRPEHDEFRWASYEEARALLPSRLLPILDWAEDRAEQAIAKKARLSVGRLFLAVPFSENTRIHLTEAIRKTVAGHSLPGRPIPSRNLHITLFFLGNVSATDFEPLTEALAAADFGPPFSLEVGPYSAFPSPSRARVFWADFVRGERELETLAGNLRDRIAPLGFHEERPFVGHITLSYLQRAKNISEIVERSRPVGIEIPVDRIVLYRSHTAARAGAPSRYQELRSYPLKKPS